MATQHDQEWQTIDPRTGEPLHLRYLLSLPDEYEHPSDRHWPLVLFLHGVGERGSDLHAVTRHGVPRLIEAGRRFPFITVSPQCPADHSWTSLPLPGLLDHAIAAHRVDADRVYVTGLSMGGFGTWHLAIAQPTRFAAIAPICGGGNSSRVCSIAHLPIWAFHGAKDDVVPLAASADMINALYECGGNPRFTVYPEATHDSWTVTYENPTLYSWLLSHSRSDSPATAR